MLVGCGSLAVPRVVPWVEDGTLGGQRGRLRAAWGVSRTLCQQLPWFLVESLSAGQQRQQEGVCGLRDTVGAAVIRQQPEPKCCLPSTRSAPWGVRSVPAPALPGCAGTDGDCSKLVAHGDWLHLGREGGQLREGAVGPLG